MHRLSLKKKSKFEDIKVNVTIFHHPFLEKYLIGLTYLRERKENITVSQEENMEIKVSNLRLGLLDILQRSLKDEKVLYISKDFKANPYIQSILDHGLAIITPAKNGAKTKQAPLTRFIQLPHLSDQDI